MALARRLGEWLVVTSGLVLVAGGLGALSFVSPTTPYVPYGLALVLVATGMGLSVPSLSTGIVTSLHDALDPALLGAFGVALGFAARRSVSTRAGVR